MALEASLLTMPIGEILTWIGSANRTGTLKLTRRGVEKKLYVEKGKLVAVSSNDPAEFLGQVLLSLGMVTESNLADAFRLQGETRQLLGRVLVERFGVIDEMLMEALHHRAEEAVFDLFLWRDGKTHFSELLDRVPDAERLQPALEIPSIIEEGNRRMGVWTQLQKRFPSRLCRVELAAKMPEKGLARSNHVLPTLMSRLATPKSIEGLVLETHAAPFLVYEALGLLFDVGAIRLDPKWQDPERNQKAARSLGATVHSNVAQAEDHLREGRIQKALELLEGMIEIEDDLARVRAVVEQARGSYKTRWYSEIAGSTVFEREPQAKHESTGDSIRNEHADFIFSQLSGSWDVRTLLKLMPLGEQEILQTLRDLLDRKLIRMKGKSA